MNKAELRRLAVKDILVGLARVDPKLEAYLEDLFLEEERGEIDSRWARVLVRGSMILEEAERTYLREETGELPICNGCGQEIPQ